MASAFTRGIVETTGNYIGWLDTNMDELAPKFNEMIKELESGIEISCDDIFTKLFIIQHK